MKTTYELFLPAVCAILLFSGCATIFSHSNYPLTIESNPSSAKIVVKDKKGVVRDRGTTPATVFLKASNGYFSRAAYTIEYSKEGYETRSVSVAFTVNGWFYGNLLSPVGLIGMLIVDPITGAMYELNYKTVLTDLKATDKDSSRIIIMDIGDLTDTEKESLERID